MWMDGCQPGGGVDRDTVVKVPLGRPHLHRHAKTLSLASSSSSSSLSQTPTTLTMSQEKVCFISILYDTWFVAAKRQQ